MKKLLILFSEGLLVESTISGKFLCSNLVRFTNENILNFIVGMLEYLSEILCSERLLCNKLVSFTNTRNLN
jgi:hypothetical protein